MKYTSTFILLLLGSPLIAAAQPVTVSATNLRELLTAKNAKVQAVQAEVQAAQDRQGALGRSFIPSLELHAAQENFKKGQADSKTQPTYGAELSMNLFNGGKDKLESQIRDLEVSKKSYEGQKVLTEELEKVRGLYWELRYLEEKKNLLNTTLTVNKQNLNSAQRRIRSGVATDSDRFEFEMKNVDLERDLKEANLKFGQQKRQLALLLGLDIGTEFTFSDSLQHDHDFEQKLNIPEQLPAFLYKESAIASEQSALLAKQNHRTWWPKLDAYAGYNQFNEREEEFASVADRTESVVGLRVSINLSQGFESRKEALAAQRMAAAQSGISQYQHQEGRAEIQKEIEDLRFLHDQIHDAEENIGRAENYYRMTQSEYTRGVKNSPDVLGASEKLYEMRHKRLEIIKNFQTAKAHIMSKLGR